MRAATVDRYGPPDVVRIVEVDDPAAKPGELLVRVAATPVTSGDARIRGARFPRGFAFPARLALGIRRPRQPILGGSFAGTIVSTGERVAGMTWPKMGAHAELVAVKAAKAIPIPAVVSEIDAAAVLFGGTTALHFLRKAGVGAGDQVLINGAAGAVGTNAVQLARSRGATVTGVCRGTNAGLVRRLGAGAIVDHTTTDLARIAERFDVVFDTVGNLSVRAGRDLLRPGGRLIQAVGGLATVVLPRRRVITGTAAESPDDMRELLGLVETGQLEVVIDEAFTLDDIVAAHSRVDTGHKIGNVIIRVA